jgi:hypothetical protein
MIIRLMCSTRKNLSTLSFIEAALNTTFGLMKYSTRPNRSCKCMIIMDNLLKMQSFWLAADFPASLTIELMIAARIKIRAIHLSPEWICKKAV